MLSLLAAPGSRHISRRGWMRLGMLGAAGAAGLGHWAGAYGAATSPKARRCIYIFLCGGPSQHDLWDPKPDAPEGIRSEFRTIDTSSPGIRFTELIPNVALHADKLAVIRSMTATSPDHNYGIAHTLLGRKPPRPDDLFVGPQDHPSLGAILHKLRGESGILPPWVVLPRPFTTLSPPHKGQSAGFLGPAFEPVTLNEPQKDSLAPKDLKFDAFSLPATVDADRLDARRALLAAGEDALAGTAVGRRWQSDYENATRMLTSDACRAAFDLTREPDIVRDRYGRHEYGQSFLLARRLIESGVPFVNVFWTYFDEKGCQFNLWDNHGVTTDICGVGGILSGKQMLTHRYCTPSFDQAFPALLEDLAARGLLDETLVVVAGDFGRTPKINAMSGRDHWANCYTQLLAGGGVRGGQVYGASDKAGAYVKDRPVTPEDFHATILHAMGVSPDATIQDPLGRPIRVSEGMPLVELF